MLLPEDVCFLLSPIAALGAELEIEVVENLGGNQAHLVVCHTRSTVSLQQSRYAKLDVNLLLANTIS